MFLSSKLYREMSYVMLCSVKFVLSMLNPLKYMIKQESI